jgi:hypothetical protein
VLHSSDKIKFIFIPLNGGKQYITDMQVLPYTSSGGVQHPQELSHGARCRATSFFKKSAWTLYLLASSTWRIVVYFGDCTRSTRFCHLWCSFGESLDHCVLFQWIHHWSLCSNCLFLVHCMGHLLPTFTTVPEPVIFLRRLGLDHHLFAIPHKASVGFHHWFSQTLTKCDISPLLKVIHFPVWNIPSIIFSGTYYTCQSKMDWKISPYIRGMHILTCINRLLPICCNVTVFTSVLECSVATTYNLLH